MFSWDIFLNAERFFSWIMAGHPHFVYLALFMIVFLESGVFFLPFLPGDSLLLIAGASLLRFSLNPFFLLSALILGSFLGNLCGYGMGFFLCFWRGQKRTLSFFIRDGWLDRVHTFFDRYGKLSIVISRFIPFLRTFFPFLSGVFHVSFHSFVLFSLLGGVLWTCFFVLMGWFIGQWGIVQDWLGRFSLVVVCLSFLSFFYWLYRRWNQRQR